MTSSLPHPLAVLVHCRPDYAGLSSPFSPATDHPELPHLKPHLSSAPNHVYDAVRRTLGHLGLDRDHFGSPQWNPFRDFVKPGQTVVIKPNLVRDSNPEPRGTTDSLVSHLGVIRPLIDYALLALDFRGRVVVTDAPQQDCNLDNLLAWWGMSGLRDFYQTHFDFNVEFLDLRRETVLFRDGVIVDRHKLPGDPAGYTLFDLGTDSTLDELGENLRLLRGADYDHEITLAHHRPGLHEYLLSNTILQADFLINVPKIKTHKKSGVTLALKNLVGINGDKNWLPHFRPGFPETGGDEFPCPTLKRRIRSFAVERARRWLRAGKFTGLIRWARRFEQRHLHIDEERSGNWYGNDTIWRMVLDLNRVLYFGDPATGRIDPTRPRRRVLVVMDGVVAGEGCGPLMPIDRPLGLVCASLDPVAADLAVVKTMGFDVSRIPKITHALQSSSFLITDVRTFDDVLVSCSSSDDPEPRLHPIHSLEPGDSFLPHPGWKVLVPNVVDPCPL